MKGFIFDNLIKYNLKDILLENRRYISEKYCHYSKNIFIDIEINQAVRLYPNLIILGAQKSGTTSLHFYLDQHPDIFMSKPLKEPGFFRSPEQNIKYYSKRNISIKNRDYLLSNFMLQGYLGEKYIGDSSTFYTNKNINKNSEIGVSIKSFTKTPKLIYIIRNPFHRVVSNYLHSIERGYIKCTFNDWILGRGKQNIYTSMYFFQLNRYLLLFPREYFHIVYYDNLIGSAEEELQKIEAFLELDVFKNYMIKRYNKTSVTMSKEEKGKLWDCDKLGHLRKLIVEDLYKFEKILDLKVPEHFFNHSY